MEKRFQVVDGVLVVSVLIPLGPDEQIKLEHKDLEPKINRIAKDFSVDWAVEMSGNIATVAISRTFGPVVGERESHELDVQATNFMTAIEHLELPKPILRRQNATIQDVEDDYNYIKMLVETWNADEKENRAAKSSFTVMMESDFFGMACEVPCARIPGHLAKELCLSYLKIHSHDKN